MKAQANEWITVMRLKGEREGDEFLKGITLEIEIVCPKGPGCTDYMEEVPSPIWRFTVERKDANYRRSQSFDVDPYVSLADISSWIGEQVTYAAQSDPNLRAQWVARLAEEDDEDH